MGVTEMDVDVSAVLSPGKFFLQKLGFWFETFAFVGRWKRVLRFVVIFNVFLVIALNISTIFSARTKSLVESTFEVMYLMRQISVCQKMIVFRFRAHEIGDLFSNAFEKISVPDLADEIFEKYQYECKKKPRLILGAIVLSFLNSLIWITSLVASAYFSASQFTDSSLLGGATALPIWLPFDLNEYPLLKIFVLTCQLLVMQPIMFTMLGFFAFYSGALKLSHEMFKHFNDILILLQKPVNRDPPFKYRMYVRQNQEVKDIIKYAVQHHIRSLKYY
jgi:hypothetical protein